MNKNYIRGRTKEYQAKNELENQGYLVTRSAGSKGVYDLWAVDSRNLKLIQLKRSKKTLTPAQLEVVFKDAIESMRGIYHLPDIAQKELWVWLDRKGWLKFRIKDDEIVQLFH